jgi:hypothetical protein
MVTARGYGSPAKAESRSGDGARNGSKMCSDPNRSRSFAERAVLK